MLYLKQHQIFSITKLSSYLNKQIAIELFKRLDFQDLEHKSLIIIIRNI